jgi:hypothetical protein
MSTLDMASGYYQVNVDEHDRLFFRPSSGGETHSEDDGSIIPFSRGCV